MTGSGTPPLKEDKDWIDLAPERLSNHQLLLLSAQLRTQGQEGDRRALLVADALSLVANHRVAVEAGTTGRGSPDPDSTLAGR